MVVGEISEERDLIIIGGGPGGYSAAIRGAQLGLSVTLIEEVDMGGICLNKGCIPSKVLSHAAQKRVEMTHLEDIGLGSSDASFNMNQLLTYKSKVIKSLKTGVEGLCKQNKIEVIQGKASFIAKNRIGVEKGHQFDIFEFKQAIIATGSRAVLPGYAKKTGERIILSSDIFDLSTVPTHLIVEGSDYVALEVASSFAALGSEVTIMLNETTDFSFDSSINRELNRLFKKRKINIKKDVYIIEGTEKEDGVLVAYKTSKGEEEAIEGSHLFIQGDRKPNIDSLGIKRFEIDLTEDGFVKINQSMQSSIPSIYAIGDVTEGPLLAVKAIKQGKAAVESIAGEKPEVDLTFIPKIMHTIPPVASVGITEEEAKEFGLDMRVSQFSLRANGYATIQGKGDGFIKVISDAKTDLISGIHMIGDGAIDMSGSFVQLLEMAAKEEDVKFPSYAHPSYNEGLLEAVEGLIGQAIHAAPVKR